MGTVLAYGWLGNSFLQWLLAVGVAAFAAVVIAALLRLARTRMTAWAQSSDGQFDDAVAAMLQGTRRWFVLAVAVLLGVETLTLPERLAELVTRFCVVAVLLQAGLWLHAGIGGWLSGQLQRRRSSDATSATTATILGFIARVVTWTLVLLLVLKNFGVDITALVASLGIGGIAVALAVQNILGDVFASLAIALDQPVVIGDFIVVGDVMGTVERIGLKTTHLRSLSGELVVLANNDLLSSRIRNFKRMFQRRILFGFRVSYDTPPQKLRRIPELVREIVERNELARFDRAHFASFGTFALEFEVVYFVRDPDYNRYMDIQQRINLDLIEALGASSVKFAYPTRTVHLVAPVGQV